MMSSINHWQIPRYLTIWHSSMPNAIPKSKLILREEWYFMAEITLSVINTTPQYATSCY
jgi:hypothetical protein